VNGDNVDSRVTEDGHIAAIDLAGDDLVHLSACDPLDAVNTVLVYVVEVIADLKNGDWGEGQVEVKRAEHRAILGSAQNKSYRQGLR
jgi:hypothetical protein